MLCVVFSNGFSDVDLVFWCGGEGGGLFLCVDVGGDWLLWWCVCLLLVGCCGCELGGLGNWCWNESVGCCCEGEW